MFVKFVLLSSVYVVTRMLKFPYAFSGLVKLQTTTAKKLFPTAYHALRFLTENGLITSFRKNARSLPKHITRIHYLSCNKSKVEAAFNDATSIVKKSDDICLTLINIRNTPHRSDSFSRVQQLMETYLLHTLSEDLLKPSPAGPSTVYSEITLQNKASKA